MERINRFFDEPPTEKQKEQAYEKRLKKQIQDIENLALIGVSSELLDLVRMELDGGRCPQCGRLWKREDFNNLFGKGHYYRPVCRCYVRCPRCGQDLYREEVSGVLEAKKWICPNCEWRLKIDDKMRYGKAYEEMRAQSLKREEDYRKNYVEKAG